MKNDKFISSVCFIRKYDHPDENGNQVEVSKVSMENQIRLNHEYGLPATYLLQYDALVDKNYAEIFMDEYKNYDALEKFKEEILSVDPLADDPACSCGLVVRGDIAPEQCALFGNACTSNSPQGACMVSSEGACAVAYRFRQ